LHIDEPLLTTYYCYKRKTCPLVREGAPHRWNGNCLTVTKMWSWAPEGAWHNDWHTDRRSFRDFDFEFGLVRELWGRQSESDAVRQSPSGRGVWVGEECPLVESAA
jgi:hypothetical protein